MLLKYSHLFIIHLVALYKPSFSLKFRQNVEMVHQPSLHILDSFLDFLSCVTSWFLFGIPWAPPPAPSTVLFILLLLPCLCVHRYSCHPCTFLFVESSPPHSQGTSHRLRVISFAIDSHPCPILYPVYCLLILPECCHFSFLLKLLVLQVQLIDN